LVFLIFGFIGWRQVLLGLCWTWFPETIYIWRAGPMGMVRPYYAFFRQNEGCRWKNCKKTMGQITTANINFVNITCDAILAAIGIFYLLFAYILTAYQFPYIPLCPFYLITSIHCPLCGMTRAFGALLHGNLVNAVTYNPLAIPLLLLWLGFTGTATFYLARDIKEIRKYSMKEQSRA
jgi:hypothetical protein